MPSVFLLCVLWALCPLSVGLPLTCPSSLNPQQGSGKLCATLQLQPKFPCPNISLSVSDNEQLDPETWHLESLSVKVEKDCSFLAFQQDKPSQHFPGGSYSDIAINSVSTLSDFVCICMKVQIRSRRASPNIFIKRHVLDHIPRNPSSNFWENVWTKSTKYRTHMPRTQTFWSKNEFNKIRFSRDYPIHISDEGNSPNLKELFRSDKKLDMYDVSYSEEGGLEVNPRNDYIVADLDNNNKPVHFEQTKDISPHLENMERNKPLRVKKTFKNWRRVLEVEDTAETGNNGGEDESPIEEGADGTPIEEGAGETAFEEGAAETAVEEGVAETAVVEGAAETAVVEGAAETAIAETAAGIAIEEGSGFALLELFASLLPLLLL